MGVILCACGKSLLSLASSNATSSPIETTAPFLYVSSSDGKIAGFSSNSSSGALTLLSGSPTSAGSSASLVGIAVLPDDDFLYVVDAAGRLADSLAIGTYGTLTSVGSTATDASPYGIAINPAATLAYVSNSGAGTISGYGVETTGLLGALSSNPVASGLSGPEGLTISPDGAFLYVAEKTGGLVDAYTIESDGTLTLINQVDSLGSVKGSPRQIAIDPAYPSSPFAYVTDVSSGTGVVSLFIIGSDGGLTFDGFFATGKAPIGVAMDPTGSFLYTANSGDNTVSQFLVNPTTGGLTALGAAPAAPSPGLSVPVGIAIDSTGTFVYVASNGNGTVAQYDINSSSGALTAEATVATGTSGPMFLAFVRD